MIVGELIKKLCMVDPELDIVLAAIPEDLEEGETLIAEDIKIVEIAHIRASGIAQDGEIVKEVVPVIALMPAYSYRAVFGGDDDEDDDDPVTSEPEDTE